MNSYGELLKTMMGSILARDPVTQGFLREKEGFPAHKQMAVYTEGYVLRLAEVLAAAYPALLDLLGVASFNALADNYIASYPSRHFNIDRYPLGFAAYVAGHTDDFAADLALLEEAIHQVYQMEESPARPVAWFAHQTPDLLAHAQFLPRVASKLLTCSYPVDEYLTLQREDKHPAKPAKAPGYVMVFRHLHQVKRIRLEAAEYQLLQILAEGKILDAALGDNRMAMYTNDDNFPPRLIGWVVRWLSEGCIREGAS